VCPCRNQGARYGRPQSAVDAIGFPTVASVPPMSASQARHVCLERVFGHSLIRVSLLPGIAAETLVFSALITGKDGCKIRSLLWHRIGTPTAFTLACRHDGIVYPWPEETVPRLSRQIGAARADTTGWSM
jgi:hypothetical protein